MTDGVYLKCSVCETFETEPEFRASNEFVCERCSGQ